MIHDLGEGGAEKVLVNLVNHMDREKFDITVIALFGGGVNEQFLAKHIRLINSFSKSFPGNSKVFKLFSPSFLHKRFVKERYDIEVAFLEGPATRIIAGCPNEGTKLVAWIHTEFKDRKIAAGSFRSFEESKICYEKFEQVVGVSDSVRKAYCSMHHDDSAVTLYNVIDSEKIRALAKEEPVNSAFEDNNSFKIVSTGKIAPVKGYDRLARIHKRLRDQGYPIHTYLLGKGPQQAEIEQYLQQNQLTDSFTFLGYQTNPYQYVKRSDLFVCSSFREGLSTAVTEALIVGTPVCTTDVSGMRELLGENGEYGLIVENEEEALYQGIKRLLDDFDLLIHYREQAEKRGDGFNVKNTVEAVENVLDQIYPIKTEIG